MEIYNRKTLLILSLILLTDHVFAIQAKKGIITSPAEILNRSCVLEFSPEPGRFDILSAFLVGPNKVISVGHTPFFNRDLKIKCGVTGKRSFRDRGRQRHPNYDYRDNPSGIDKWAHYDFSIIQIENEKAAVLPKIPIESDSKVVANLLMKGKCIYGGAGDDSGNDVGGRSVKFVQAVTKVSLVNSYHVGVEYPGEPIVVEGDSGGPVICQHDSGEYVLAGLLEYGGVISGPVKGKRNFVGIMILRDELVQYLERF